MNSIVRIKPPYFYEGLLEQIPTDRVLILATGPNGKPFHNFVRNSSIYTIGVSGAINILKPDLWVCADPDMEPIPWFKNPPHKCLRLFGEKMWTLGNDADYIFDLFPVWEIGSDFSPTLLRGELTITGCAVQLCVLAGVKQICLIGCDLSNNTYYDANPIRMPYIYNQHDNTWVQLLRFNDMVQKALERGITICSLSPTAIRCPIVTETEIYG